MRNNVYIIFFITNLLYLAGCVSNTDKLYIACREGDIKLLRELPLSELDLDKADSTGKTPLIHAVYSENLEAIKLLLSNGAGLNIQAKDGWTPLMIAVLKANEGIAKYLIDNGADVNLKSSDGGTALIIACFWNRISMVDLLLSNGANPNIYYDYGESPLMLASERGCKEIVINLLKYKADVNAQSRALGFTPLIFAVNSGHIDITKLLIANGADINITSYQRNRFFFTALEFARRRRYDEIAKYLMKHGAREHSSYDINTIPIAPPHESDP